jgi:hypothetical protein
MDFPYCVSRFWSENLLIPLLGLVSCLYMMEEQVFELDLFYNLVID